MDEASTGRPGRAADGLANGAIPRRMAKERRGLTGNRWSLLLRSRNTGAIRRRGKSELHRAGWSVTRTVPGSTDRG